MYTMLILTFCRPSLCPHAPNRNIHDSPERVYKSRAVWNSLKHGRLFGSQLTEKLCLGLSCRVFKLGFPAFHKYLLHVCYMYRPAHPSSFYQTNNEFFNNDSMYHSTTQTFCSSRTVSSLTLLPETLTMLHSGHTQNYKTRYMHV